MQAQSRGRESLVEVIRRPEFVTPLKIVSVVTAVLILTQAALAGRGSFLDPDMIELHGYVGNATFLAAIAQFGLAWMAGVPDRAGKRLVITAGVLVALVFIQTGLGYAGRDNADAAAWHIPLGVLAFGAAAMVASLSSQIRKE